jgi:hypothetical protein
MPLRPSQSEAYGLLPCNGWAWLKTAGMALGIAAMVTLLSFSWGFEASHIAWTIGIPFAALIYAVGTLPVMSGLLRSSSGR